MRSPRDLSGRVRVPAAEHASTKLLCLDSGSNRSNRRPEPTDDAPAGTVRNLPNLGFLSGKRFKEQLICFDAKAKIDFRYLSVDMINEGHPDKKMRAQLPERDGIARERQKIGVSECNKCLFGAQK